MRKLKWWHWVLIVFFGLIVISSIAAPRPDKRPQPGSPALSPTFVDANPKFELIAGDAIYSMTFDAGADPQTLPDIAREHCGKQSFCKVLGWTDPKYAARGFPMTDREVAAEAFAYSLNRSTGFEQTMWDCKRWKRSNRDECLSTDGP